MASSGEALSCKLRGGGHSEHVHFWVRVLPKVIFLGPKKTETMFMIFFYIKHRLIDISGFVGSNPDLYLHCLGVFYVHVQVSKYKMS